MAQRNRKLLLGFGLAIAVCVVVALLDSVLVGVIGAGLAVLIFALAYLSSDLSEHNAGVRHATGPWEEEDGVHRDWGAPNPENVSVPIYYQIERQD